MMQLSRRGQNWTVDLLVGVIIFLSIALFFYTMTQSNLSQDTTFTQSADPLIDQLNAQNYPEGYNATPVPLQGYTVDRDELKALFAENYSEIKAELNFDNEFCMVLTRNDSLVSLNVSGTEQYSVGENDGDVLITEDIRCGQ
jgi:ABC-type glycerol-3-phosphate transport system permease component